jgi:hypothetical protein
MTSPVHAENQPAARRLSARIVQLATTGLIAVPMVLAVIVLSGMRNQYADLLAQFVAPTLFGTLALAIA